MNVHGTHFRTIWLKPDDPAVVQIIDQRQLPFAFVVEDIRTVDEMAVAIKDMHVRGAGLIGAAAGYGMYLATMQAPRTSPEVFRASVAAMGDQLKATRPTAVNLAWAVDRQLAAMDAAGSEIDAQMAAVKQTAQTIADEDAEFCRRIGEHGVALIEEISRRKGGAPVNVLTHCNAGWLAFVDYGTATAPIYAAHDRGIPVHVWVDETRPRNQGARLTAWELGQHGVPHTVIVDNVGGHLMQHGLVDLVITGTDRTTYTGDVANKIGTYLKALAAHDNGVPFYVALPSSTFDWEMRDGLAEIPIEQRDATEVRIIDGLHRGAVTDVLLTPEASPAANYAFDVTPARLVSGLITERGICAASEAGVLGLYPEKRQN
ncbi:MAG: S-methyl-5-thioribose-1-phosphate isomerase [Caldilinea sp.]|nr:S-methyl-5-thioribose-1-phosphate isomerase [Caldilineaceae bacterium]MCB9121620.1 S-methyl-5-thioribose-1-phosphate isomerase [Caldilineaceae bacterium]MCB9123710.1 S-methyl-5-thioribose-1-phosphate isomerase [Caldilineaceae bacterium]MCO5213582.1 S-methyl-5-thioribose-1-phosphate isomerase [Caldilinea sp.]MCW5844985.1 S-methyl-5-thioribose-1-phosphate isomerase [Caldilinea sp.]